MTRRKLGMSWTIAALAAALASCTSPASGQGDAGTGAPQSSSAPASYKAVVDARGRSDDIENDLYSFTYSYPAEAVRIPGLNALLAARLERARDELAAMTKQEKDEADAQGYPFRPHYLSVSWDVAADLPRWLMLQAAIETYSGGAHGNRGFDSLLWDKQTGTALQAIDLFTSSAALRRAVQPAFCNAIDKEREERRGMAVNRDSGDMFDACIDPLESTIVLTEQMARRFDTVTVLVAPYAAGSYAEGTFEIALPVTDAVRAAVKPEYREAFVTGG